MLDKVLHNIKEIIGIEKFDKLPHFKKVMWYCDKW